MSQQLPESWAPPSEPAAEPAAGTPAVAPVTEPPVAETPTEPATPEPAPDVSAAETGGDAAETGTDTAEPVAAVPAEVPVADQLAAGVPADATVTLADQRAGVATAPVVVADDGSLAPHPDVLPADPTAGSGTSSESAAAEDVVASTDEVAAAPAELPPHMANYVPQPDGTWASPPAQPVAAPIPTAAELADAKAAKAAAENVAARLYHAAKAAVRVIEALAEDAVKDLPPGTLQAAEAAALDALRSAV